jgi:hypothetical protein
MFSGCASQLRNKQLENVAKDWSYVVRASQVIPVYPLTEDLQPGDILLVSTPIDEQQKIYEKKGYLPLDQLLKRLNPQEYRAFYMGRYGTDDGKIPPSKWQETVAFGNQSSNQWKLAPSAAFPSYDFEVSTGAGMNLAIPVQGVPIALGLMKTGKAKGSVTIGKAHTYGLDNVTLKAEVDEWAATNRELLRSYKPVEKDGKKQMHFLRVVSRVYVVGDVSVTVNNDESTSGDLGGGADKTVALPELKDKDAAQNYQDALKVFNDVLKDQLPGGKVKFAAASSRSVTLNEHFDHPLVIGYAGFDMPIIEGGRLGAPISTLAQLTDTPIIAAENNNNIYRLAAFAHMNRALQDIPGPKADKIRENLDKLGALLPEAYPFTFYEFASATDLKKSASVVTGAKVTKRDFEGALNYLSIGQKTVENIDRYLAQPKAIPAAERVIMQADLQSAREAMEKMNRDFGKQPALAEAVDFVFLGY